MRYKQVCHLNSVKFLGKRKKHKHTEKEKQTDRYRQKDRKTETDKDKQDKVNKGQKGKIYMCI